MKTTTITVAVLISLILAGVSKGSPASVVSTPIRVVFVEPTGEDFTQEEMDQSVLQIQRAMDWWLALAPTPRPLVISETAVMTTTTDIFDTTIDMSNSSIDSIYILDNSSSGRLIHNAVFGAMTSSHQIWIVNGFVDMESTIAHELGHLVWRLPDWYAEPGKCAGVIDIMCFSAAAYHQRFIGCFSLERLGHHCDRIHIPYVHGYPVP